MSDRKKIMVVDDNTVNLATVEQELKDDYEVIPMLTGRRAIKYLYRDKVDLILLDVEMPIMDGIDTLKEIRTQENGTTIPVIFLTSKRDAQTVIEGSRLGIMDYITKPFDSLDLKNRIENVFKRIGVTPLTKKEIYDNVNELYNDLLDGNSKAAQTKIEEMLQYSIDEDIAGRLRNVKGRIERGDSTGASSMVEHIIAMMQHGQGGDNLDDLIPITLTEVSARLLYIQDDMENYRTSDAIDKLENLLGYEISGPLRREAKRTIDKLKDYDDIEAKAVLEVMMRIVQDETSRVIEQERAGVVPSKPL